MSKAAAVNAADWEKEVLQSDVPVLVDFWATWCGPCRAISPHVDAISEEFAGKAKVFKVDVDSEPDLAGRYNVMSIPNLLLFKEGKLVDQVVGAVSKNVLSDRLNKLVS
jgi:thioredoxin 1